MAEFDEKLNAILSDPQAMKQIMSIAKALGGSEEENADKSAPGAQPDAPPGTAQKIDASSILSPLEGLDPKLVQAALRLFSEYYSTDSRKTALLTALLPFLKEERYAKVDKAVQITKLSRVVRVAFQLLKGGEERV
jgi:hypothetical protein